MQIITAITACVLLACTLAVAQTKTPESEYATLLAQLKSGTTSIDYKKLRISFMDSPEQKQAKNTDTEKRGMTTALNEKQYEKAIQNANVVLANEYVDIEAHLVEHIAYRELDHPQEARFHKAILNGLLQSITSSGNGLTKEDAFVVISPNEEYVLLRVLKLMPQKQSLAHYDGHSYDVIEAKDQESGQTLTLYFNIDVWMKHLDRVLH